MTQQIINVGTGPNTGTGDNLRAGMVKVNSNFTELYSIVGGAESITSLTAGTGISLSNSIGNVTISVNGNGNVTGITGTANQIIATANTGNITLSTPQSIATTSSPTFSGLTITGLTGYLYGNGGNVVTTSTTIPNTSITGLGTMSTQNASSVTISGGTINGTTIGATTTSTGAFTTLNTSGLATLYGVTTPSTGNFYAGQGASISRINDRLFVGAATANNGTQVASQPDWLTTFQISTGRTGGFIQESSFAALNGSNPQNANTMVTGAQSTNITLSGLNAIGAISIGVNNNTATSGINAYAGYNEAYRMSGALGGAYGYEIDTVNFASDVTTDPYQQAATETVALQLASGAGLPSAGQFPSQAAINIQNNNSTFDVGINFGSTALTSGIAVAMGSGHTAQWYGAAGVKTSSIVCSGTTAAAGIQQAFFNNEVQFNNNGGKQILDIFGVTNGVNGIQILGAVTTASPQFVAIGSDTNISLELSPKGNGTVVINGTLTPSQTGGIIGTTAANNANAGSVGEYNTTTSSGTSTPSGTGTTVAALSLTAGDWDVSGSLRFNPSSGVTSFTTAQAGISTVVNTLGVLGTYNSLSPAFAAGANPEVLITPTVRISIASTTTVYLVALPNYVNGSMTGDGFIRARRVR